MEKTIIISSAKLVTPKGRNATGKHLQVSYVENKPDGTKATHDKVQFTANPHEDLTAAFGKLGYHIGNMTDQYDSDGDIDTAHIEARGFSISGEGEKESLILTGVRTLHSGRALTLNTPLQRLSGESENAYGALEQVQEILTECEKEVRLYLLEGKHAPTSPDLFNGKTEEVNEEELAENEA